MEDIRGITVRPDVRQGCGNSRCIHVKSGIIKEERDDCPRPNDCERVFIVSRADDEHLTSLHRTAFVSPSRSGTLRAP